MEAADIIADAGVRLGSQEITRRGMKPEHMEIIAELITQRLDGKHPDKIKQEVHSLTNQFQAVDFCFNAGE